MSSDRSAAQQPLAAARMGTLDGLFDRLGELRSQSRRGETLIVLRASSCVTNDKQLRDLIENCNLVFGQMAAKAKGQCFHLSALDYAFLTNDSNEAGREFLPNLRIALFKVLSRVGAGQSTADGQGSQIDHFDLAHDFSEAAKFVITYIKAAREAKSAAANGDVARLLTEEDLKAVIAGYRKVGAKKFLRSFARGQPICVSADSSQLKPAITEFYISIDHLKKPFFEGVDLRASGDRFIELTKILDSIMLNAFPTLSEASKGKKISINLNVQSVFSKAFDTFIAQTPPEVMRNVVVEFRQEDAVLNYDGYAIAQQHLRSKGARVAIDQISPSAIGLVNIGFLDAEIAKLSWQADAESNFYERREILERFRQAGIQPVLSRVDIERARDVGRDLGIEMFQGFLIDDRLKSESRQSTAAFA